MSNKTAPGPDGSTGRAGSPRWLRVTAIVAASASVLALVGVAAVARGPEHHGPASAGAHMARIDVAPAAYHGGTVAPVRLGDRGGREGRLADLRERRADRREERRSTARAQRVDSVATSLGVDPQALEAALAVGRAAAREAGRVAALEAIAETLGIDVVALEAALAEVMPQPEG